MSSRTSSAPKQSTWSSVYGERHKLRRIRDFPQGIARPKKVRVYARGDHYILQFWDPAAKRTLSERVDGDLLAALIRARELDERIVNFGRSGSGVGRLTHDHLVELYGGDLNKRAEAGEIDPGTVRRYQDALRHYLAFVARSGSSGRVDDIRRVDREFQLALAAHLQSTLITSNGRAAGERRRMNRPDFVLDVVRSLYRWAADPQRGNLLGNSFVNPFNRSAEQRRLVRQDPTAEPPITLSMAATFLLACDPWQLPLFSGLALWGLRPSELIWLFREDIAEEWLAVRCHPDLEYYTKGRRDKRLPLLEEIEIWPRPPAVGEGLLFRSRNASSQPVASLANIIEEYRRRAAKVSTVVERRKVRDQVVRHCGGLSYDQIEQEFHQVANRLDWPRTATLKGFRHLFATSLENGGMPEFYRRYLMGQSAGRSAIVTYTHLNQVRQQYGRIVKAELGEVVLAISRRRQQLAEQQW